MNKEKRRVPKLRFPGFTEDWEQRKLGDFYTFKNGLNKEKVYFGYGDSIVNFTDVFHNRQIYSSTLKGKVCVNKKELENYKVKEGDLFFTRTSETIEEIGFPAVVMEPMERVVFSGFVLRGRAEKYDPLVNIFKSYIFFTDNFRSEMKKKSSMTTRALTSGTALKEMYFSYPRDLEEQNKIGEILLRLDKIITLHQRKLKHLNFKKKALLQKLFPKNGERHPELRFPEFTDAWEQRKLGECVDISTGYPFDSQDFNENGEYLVITNSNIQENTPFVLNNIGNRIDLDDSLKKYILDIDDLLITMDGTVGRVAIVVDTKLVLAQRVCRIKSNEPYYIYQLLSKNNFIQSMNKISHGGTIKHISLSEISEYQAFYPKSQKERIKISSVLTNYDKLITLHQRKLEHLQLQKKALLQQMFV